MAAKAALLNSSVKLVDFDIPATASPAVGAPPEGLVAFYWHFIRQTKGWYAAMSAEIWDA